MSVSKIIDGLITQFQGIPNPLFPTWGNAALTVKRITEKVNQEDFPLMLIGFDPAKENSFELHITGDDYHHNYSLAIFIFVSGSNTDIDEMHKRIEPWPDLLVQPTVNFVLSNPETIAIGDGTHFLPYKVGQWPITKDNYYFGLKTSLSIME